MRKGNWVVLLTVLVSVNLFVLSKGEIGGFGGSIWLTLGQLAAIVGVVLFCINMMLSSKFDFLNDLWGSLDKRLKYHKWYGISASMLILFHPIWIGVSRIPNYERVRQLFWPGKMLEYNLGIMALYGTILLVVLTLFVKMKYDVWLRTHQFMGLMALIAAAHILTIGSDVGRYVWLKVWILFWMLAAMGVFIINKFGKKNMYKYKVSKVNKIGKVVEISMEAENEKMKFEAGQYAYFEFKKFGKERHPFSIASSPDKDELMIAVKALGDFTEKLQEVEVGDEVEVYGAYGEFGKDIGENNDAVLIAGGIGITPIISIVDWWKKQKTKNKLNLVYSVKNKEDAYGVEYLPKEGSEIWESDTKGRLTAKSVVEMVGGVLGKEFYICGPKGMIDAFSEDLMKMGVNKNLIHYEDFWLK